MSRNQHGMAQQNWATNIQFQAAKYEAPETVEQLQEIVRTADKVRVVGTGHSFNDIADTTGTLISLERLDKSVTFDHARQTATVNPGISYIELAPILDRAGYALPNLASLPHFTVMGACATATHGSGDENKNLATHISALELVNAEGELVQLSREQDGERFDGAVVALGGLGVVTQVTLDLVPTFTMKQYVYQWLLLADMVGRFDEIMSSGYSVSLFTLWQYKSINQIWVKKKVMGEDEYPVAANFLGAQLADVDFHPIDDASAEPCTVQRGIPGPWYERLPHFHMQSEMTGENERQTEYFVPREKAIGALLAVESLQEQMAPFLKVSEVRSVAADTLWLSPAYEQDCIGIHFSWADKQAEIEQFLPILEAHLAPFEAKPHWGKLFAMPPEQVRALYKRMSDFQSLVAEFDPNGKFCNPYLARYICD